MQPTFRCAAALAVATISTIAAADPAPGTAFYPLLNWSEAFNVSDDGKVLIRPAQGPGYIWTQSGITQTNSLPRSNGRISADGRVIAYNPTVDDACYRYDIQSGTEFLLPLPPGGYNTSVTGISGDGSVIVGNANTGDLAWRWTAATGTQNIDPALLFSRATDISYDGNTVIGDWSSGAFVHRVGQGTTFVPSFPNQQETEFRALSRNEQVIVGGAYSGGIARSGPAFRWTPEGGYQTLGSIGSIPGTQSQNYIATATNADGSLIFGTQGGRRAWIWDEDHGMRDLIAYLTDEFDLDLSGWNLGTVTSVSPDGRYIVGNGFYSAGGGTASRPWIVVLPSPGAAGLLAAAGLLGVRRRR